MARTPSLAGGKSPAMLSAQPNAGGGRGGFDYSGSSPSTGQQRKQASNAIVPPPLSLQELQDMQVATEDSGSPSSTPFSSLSSSASAPGVVIVANPTHDKTNRVLSSLVGSTYQLKQDMAPGLDAGTITAMSNRTLRDVVQDNLSGVSSESASKRKASKRMHRQEQRKKKQRAKERVARGLPAESPERETGPSVATSQLNATVQLSQGLLSSAASSSSSQPAAPTSAVPQVQIIDGVIVLNAASVHTVATQRENKNVTYDIVREDERQAVTTASFRNNSATEKWTMEDTKLFYKYLSQYGTDFSLIAQFFPTRSRKQIKAKFKKEDKQHEDLVNLALKTVMPMDVDEFAENRQAKIEHLAKEKAEEEKKNGGSSSQ